MTLVKFRIVGGDFLHQAIALFIAFELVLGQTNQQFHVGWLGNQAVFPFRVGKVVKLPLAPPLS